MANPIPTLMVVNYKGSGNVQVYPLLNGTTLDAQDGINVLTGTLESPGTNVNNHANHLIEAFGNRYLSHGERTYERDSGGAGTWGVVHSTGGITAATHSGLHLLYPAGVPTLAFLDWQPTTTDAIDLHKSTDGTSFSSSNVGSQGGGLIYLGNSVVYRNSIAWILRGNSGGVVIHDLNLSSTIIPSLTQTPQTGSTSSILVHKNQLFVAYAGASAFRIDRLDGASWTNIFSAGFWNSVLSCSEMFSDGEEIILIFDEFSPSSHAAWAITDPTGVTPGSVNISTPVVSSVSHASPSGWNRFVSVDPDPSAVTIYLWVNLGNVNTGTFGLYRYQYRRITQTGLTTGAFTLHEFVEQAGTGARGRVMEIFLNVHLELTDVTGTFNNTGVITGDDSGATMTANSLLLYQALTSLGAGVSKVNFGLPNVSNGGLGRIPAKGNARPELAGLPAEIIGGIRRRPIKIYGTGADIDIVLYFSTNEEAPDQRGTISAITVVDVPITTGLVGNLGEVALEALSPTAGDAYVVSVVDGDSSLTPGALSIAVGDIVEYDGANWTFVLDTATAGFPDFSTHATLSSTTALISPYTDGADDGKIAAFDGTSLTGILLSVPTVVSNEARNLTPTNGATTFNLDHAATVDVIIGGQHHTVSLDIV